MSNIAATIIVVVTTMVGLATLIGTLYGIWAKIITPIKQFEKNLLELNSSLDKVVKEFSDQMKDIFTYLKKDQSRIGELSKDMQMVNRMLFQVLNHIIDGNHNDEIKKSRELLIKHSFSEGREKS